MLKNEIPCKCGFITSSLESIEGHKVGGDPEEGHLSSVIRRSIRLDRPIPSAEAWFYEHTRTTRWRSTTHQVSPRLFKWVMKLTKRRGEKNVDPFKASANEVEVPNGKFFGTHLVRCGHCLGDFDITITGLHVDSQSSDYQPGIQYQQCKNASTGRRFNESKRPNPTFLIVKHLAWLRRMREFMDLSWEVIIDVMLDLNKQHGMGNNLNIAHLSTDRPKSQTTSSGPSGNTEIEHYCPQSVWA
ncbi:hypothetical protein QJS10_CPA10g01762 [Acorus calamus]|uniref:Uncharacterized protein n=1 Tax=Acorus calamus TaxID=4465 RepID=A0AAV9DVI6_ACOCL|nr:hypothetical protein QJS10_CPA10g01762 [Acorus calamus]